MTQTTQKIEVYEYTCSKDNVSLYYYRNGAKNALNVPKSELEQWLKHYGLLCIPMTCGGVALDTEITPEEYWADIPKSEHLSDMSLYLSELFNSIR